MIALSLVARPFMNAAFCRRIAANLASEQTNEIAVRALDLRNRVLLTKLGNVRVDLLLRQRRFPLEHVREVVRAKEDDRVSEQAHPSCTRLGHEALDLCQSRRQPAVPCNSGAVAEP